MTQKIEKEAKFLIRKLEKIEASLVAMGAICTQPSTFEINLRFDTPDKTLSGSLQVLRLRQDTRARMTYKGPADASSAVSARPELEVEISDLQTGRHILEALGYQVATIYEKYRASYQIGDIEVSLDRMPFGDFIEIEGPHTAAIEMFANKLNLTWENRSAQNYLHLFATVKNNLRLELRDLTFENFKKIAVEPSQLQLQYAD